MYAARSLNAAPIHAQQSFSAKAAAATATPATRAPERTLPCGITPDILATAIHQMEPFTRHRVEELHHATSQDFLHQLSHQEHHRIISLSTNNRGSQLKQNKSTSLIRPDLSHRLLFSFNNLRRTLSQRHIPCRPPTKWVVQPLLQGSTLQLRDPTQHRRLKQPLHHRSDYMVQHPWPNGLPTVSDVYTTN